MKKIILIICLIMILVMYTKYQKVNFNQNNNVEKIQIGTIEIPKIKLKSEIVEGISKDILDANYVGHVEESFFDFENTILLAGHNDTIFKSIHTLKKWDEIFLTIEGETQKYCVFMNMEIDKNDYTYFKNIGSFVTLITCTNNSEKRRIILSKLCM